ncbi:GH39 family glycosyl hydrolase [Mucilaginibacter auburnensis]|nr:beta-xylosidase [Mucilaginibacter auburnensis]
MSILPKVYSALFLFCCLFAKVAFTQAQPATLQVNLNKEVGDMYPMWAWFGYDEPNYTYMKDGKKLLSELAALSPVPVYVRVHSMLVTGDGVAKLKWGSTNAYTEDANGNPIYNWRLVDSIYDTYIKRGIKPFAQIGFMPEALSTHPQPYKHNWTPGGKESIYTGWAYPPKDYNKWAELVYQWVKHSVDRYGKKEVESWYWELWNEPNIEYWKGTPEEFFKLYDYTVDAVKRALPTAKIGGADVAGTGGKGGTKFLTDFLTHCVSGTNYVTGKVGTPIDLVSFHAKGAPTLVNGVVRMNVGTQMRDIQKGFSIVKSFPTLKDLPIMIGESDPEGCAACGMVTSPQNAYRNGTMYPSYTAASFARKYALADQIGINFKGAVTWAFEFEDQPWFYGFRDLATNGVDKPVLNVFRMFGKMSGKRVEVQGNRMYPLKTFVDSSARGPQTDIGGLAAKSAKGATLMVWNYHDMDLQAAAEPVEVTFNGLKTGTVTLTQYLVDATHSNSYEVWKKMGSPQNPTKEQIAALEKAGMLETVGKPQKLNVKKGKLFVNAALARQGVMLLKLDW